MDQDRFDDLSRAVAETSSRRQVLKLLGVAFAGGVLAIGRPRSAQASPPPGRGCKPAGKKCQKSSQCCGNLTCQNGQCAAVDVCTASGAPCDIFNPGACCTQCCRSTVVGGGPPYVCC